MFKAVFRRLGKLGGIASVALAISLAGATLASAANSSFTDDPCSTDLALAQGFATNGQAIPAQQFVDVSGGCAGTRYTRSYVPVDRNGTPTNGYHHKVQDAVAAGGNVVFKTTAGVLGGMHINNENGSTAFVQCFDAQSASITLGTTVPDIEWKVATVTTIDASIAGGMTFGTALVCYSSTATGGGTRSGAGVQLSAFYN